MKLLHHTYFLFTARNIIYATYLLYIIDHVFVESIRFFTAIQSKEISHQKGSEKDYKKDSEKEYN